MGTCGPSLYGRELRARLVHALMQNKVIVISGLARCIDAVAHQVALGFGARTLAVQACGLDMTYPAAHADMSRKIAETGAVMSDYFLGTKPRAEYLPRRNRILDGLSLGTLVIEAGEKSGALITATFANDEGREVMAVPGKILSPQARGRSRLIRGGAKTVLDVQDILEEVHVKAPVQRQMGLPGLISPVTADPAAKPAQAARLPALPGDEALALEHLSAEPVHVDELRLIIGLAIAAVSSTLAILELKGLAKQVGAMNYALALGL